MRTLVFALLVAGGAAQVATAQHTLHGSVVAVADGDTVTVAADGGERLRLRLAAIDAPETLQPYGTAARDELARLVLNRHVTVRVVDVDAHRRAVGFVRRGELDVNYELVARGAACHFVRYARRLQTADEFVRFQQAEQAARAQRLGQWQRPDAQCGWEFRAAQRSR